jgi:hypothetical protein
MEIGALPRASHIASGCSMVRIVKTILLPKGEPYAVDGRPLLFA